MSFLSILSICECSYWRFTTWSLMHAKGYDESPQFFYRVPSVDSSWTPITGVELWLILHYMNLLRFTQLNLSIAGKKKKKINCVSFQILCRFDTRKTDLNQTSCSSDTFTRSDGEACDQQRIFKRFLVKAATSCNIHLKVQNEMNIKQGFDLTKTFV